jgi:hypothetical protein
MSSEKKSSIQCCQTHKTQQPETPTALTNQTKEPKLLAKEPQPQKPLPMGPKTRITIHFDVGFPNALYLRGEGADLSWEKGLLLKNVKADEWIWETNKPFTTCQFKILINDYEYEIGDNHLLTCGASVHYTPKFH